MLQRTRSILAFLISWIYLSLYTAIYVCGTVLTLKKFSDYTRHYAGHGWGRFPLWLSGVRLEKQGFERLETPEPRVVIFNHESTLDLFWLAGTYAPRGVAIIKKEFAYIPVINIALWSVDCIFLNRQHRQKALSALAAVAERIKQEKLSLYIAPEGTRSADGNMLPFKKGPFHVAMAGKLPIYPLVANGARELQPKGSFLSKPGVIQLHVLEPIDTSDWTAETLGTKIKEVRETMLAAKQALQEQRQ